MTGQQLQAVLFDLDGTLLDPVAAVSQALQDWLPSVGPSGDELDLIPGFLRQSETFDQLTDLWIDLEDRHLPAFRSGAITFAEQRRRRLRDFLPHAGIDLDGIDLDEAFENFLESYRSHWRPYPDVLGCLRRIARQGLAVAVLTNGTQSLEVGKTEASGIAQLCGPVFASGGIGAAKPETGAYLLVCERLGVHPAATVMVGDNYELDVRGARAAGLRAVHLDRAGTHRIADPTRIKSLAELAVDDPMLGVMDRSVV